MNRILKNILVYADQGVNGPSANAISQELQKHVDNSIRVQVVDSGFLKKADWERTTCALFMPGGECSQWDPNLTAWGKKRIYEYVKGGGRFAGFCAGAYFQASTSSFASFQRNRPDPLFSGEAVGPLFPIDSIHSPTAAKAVRVSFQFGSVWQSGSLYYQAGCYFNLHPNDHFRTQILARYRLENASLPAVIQTKVGQGSAVLCGVHPEFPWTDELSRASQPEIASLANELVEQEKFRKDAFCEIIERLDIPLKGE